MTMPAMTVQQVKQHLDAGDALTIIDVREPSEFETCRIAGAQLVPLATLPQNIDAIPRSGVVVMQCHHGGRSARATEYLMGQGFDNVVNLTGGIHAWSTEIDSNVPTY